MAGNSGAPNSNQMNLGLNQDVLGNHGTLLNSSFRLNNHLVNQESGLITSQLLSANSQLISANPAIGFHQNSIMAQRNSVTVALGQVGLSQRLNQEMRRALLTPTRVKVDRVIDYIPVPGQPGLSQVSVTEVVRTNFLAPTSVLPSVPNDISFFQRALAAQSGETAFTVSNQMNSYLLRNPRETVPSNQMNSLPLIINPAPLPITSPQHRPPNYSVLPSNLLNQTEDPQARRDCLHRLRLAYHPQPRILNLAEYPQPRRDQLLGAETLMRTLVPHWRGQVLDPEPLRVVGPDGRDRVPGSLTRTLMPDRRDRLPGTEPLREGVSDRGKEVLGPEQPRAVFSDRNPRNNPGHKRKPSLTNNPRHCKRNRTRNHNLNDDQTTTHQENPNLEETGENQVRPPKPGRRPGRPRSIPNANNNRAYDGRTHSLPYSKYGPYTCPICAGVFQTSQSFAAHMLSHYKHETKDERKRRLLARFRKKRLRLVNTYSGLTIFPKSFKAPPPPYKKQFRGKEADKQQKRNLAVVHKGNEGVQIPLYESQLFDVEILKPELM